MPPVIFQKSPTPDKFWCAVRTTWLAWLSARRDSMMRSHPDTLHGVLAPGPAVVEALWRVVETNLAKVRQELGATAGGKGSHREREKELQQCTNLICMQKLLTWRADPSGEQQKSTLWNPAAPRRNLLTAGDIMTSQPRSFPGSADPLPLDDPAGAWAGPSGLNQKWSNNAKKNGVACVWRCLTGWRSAASRINGPLHTTETFFLWQAGPYITRQRVPLTVV